MAAGAPLAVRYSLRVVFAHHVGRVAQSVRAFASHARGHGFESLHVHQASMPAVLHKHGSRLFRFSPRVQYVSNGHNEGDVLWGAWW